MSQIHVALLLFLTPVGKLAELLQNEGAATVNFSQFEPYQMFICCALTRLCCLLLLHIKFFFFFFCFPHPECGYANDKVWSRSMTLSLLHAMLGCIFQVQSGAFPRLDFHTDLVWSGFCLRCLEFWMGFGILLILIGLAICFWYWTGKGGQWKRTFFFIKFSLSKWVHSQIRASKIEWLFFSLSVQYSAH